MVLQRKFRYKVQKSLPSVLAAISRILCKKDIAQELKQKRGDAFEGHSGYRFAISKVRTRYYLEK